MPHVCEYCGCQQVPAIARLTVEHDEIRAVARELSKAASTGDDLAVCAIARQLLGLLEPHVAIEERGLFPAMATEFAEHVASLEADHEHLQAMLGEVADGTAPALRVGAALAALFDHILREQDGLFPAALSVLTPNQWDALDQVRAEVTAGEHVHSA